MTFFIASFLLLLKFIVKRNKVLFYFVSWFRISLHRSSYSHKDIDIYKLSTQI